MKTFFKTFITAAAVLLLPLQVSWAADGFLYLRDPGFKEFGPPQYPKALLSHEKHFDGYGIKCKSCHHAYENGKNVWEEGMTTLCSECHGDSKAELVNAYHMNCWGCHKKLKQQYENADAPSSDCMKCHMEKTKVEEEQKRIENKPTNDRLLNIIQTMKKDGF